MKRAHLLVVIAFFSAFTLLSLANAVIAWDEDTVSATGLMIVSIMSVAVVVIGYRRISPRLPKP